MKINLKTFQAVLSDDIQFVLTIQWLWFCSEAEGPGDREEKSTWCRRAHATSNRGRHSLPFKFDQIELILDMKHTWLIDKSSPS